MEKKQLHTQIQVSLTIRHKTPQRCICRKVFQNYYSVLLSALWVLWHHLVESTVAAVLATGRGQSEVLTSHCQVMDHMFNDTTWTLFGETATVLWDLITKSITCQFQMSLMNLICATITKQLLPTLIHKKIKLKNLPSLGMNAPDQHNFSSHLEQKPHTLNF